MNKKELKNAFEKEFEKIAVSKELKEKTLNAINSAAPSKTSHIPYLRNFAAVFVVTLLCVSIYFANNFQKNNLIKTESNSTETQNITSSAENIEQEDSEFYLLKSAPLNGNIPSKEKIKDYSFGKNDAILESTVAQDSEYISEESSAYITEKSIENLNAPVTEQEFLSSHPNAEKIEGGYSIRENNKETLYFFNNGILKNIVIIS